MFNILFYHANTLTNENLQKLLFVSVASIYFKTYIEINSPELAKKLNWLRPIQRKISDDELIAQCNSNKIDFLCISVYLWNEKYIRDQLLRVRPNLNKKIKIILGGPSVNVNLHKNYFHEHSYADYAIYGPGEAAFLDLISHVVDNKKLISFNLSNLAWFDKEKNKQIVSEYKNVPQSIISPYLYNQEYFGDIINHEQQNYDCSLVVPYELTRGCPYSCTFCDWNSGLSNKVSRRKHTYKDEIDLFQKLKIKYIYFSDANFGQYDEDMDIVKYLADKNINENAGFKVDGNLSKLKKENNLKIYHMFAQADLVAKGWAFTFSVQDINKTVLKNINRPDVGWDVHKKMIAELSEFYPEYVSKVQFIVGLPGQTPQTIIDSLSTIIELPHVILCPFISEILPASPAELDKNYQEKFQFEYSASKRIDEEGNFFVGKFPQSCTSFNAREFVEMIVLTTFMSGLSSFRHFTNFDQLTYIDNTKLIIEAFINSNQFYCLTNNLYENWQKNDQFFYTIDFDLNEENISACSMLSTGIKWIESVTMKKILMQLNFKNIKKQYLVQKILDNKPAKSWYS